MPTKTHAAADHPWHRAMRDCIMYDTTPERTRIALAAYYGLVSFMDANMGRVLDALGARPVRQHTGHLHLGSWRQYR